MDWDLNNLPVRYADEPVVALEKKRLTNHDLAIWDEIDRGTPRKIEGETQLIDLCQIGWCDFFLLEQTKRGFRTRRYRVVVPDTDEKPIAQGLSLKVTNVTLRRVEVEPLNQLSKDWLISFFAEQAVKFEGDQAYQGNSVVLQRETFERLRPIWGPVCEVAGHLCSGS